MFADLGVATAFVLFCVLCLVVFGFCMWWAFRLVIAIAVWMFDAVEERRRGW